MPNSEMEEIFCQSQVRFYNQPVGIIIAKSFELANQVSELVKIIFQENG
jgi:xanthine dehydrogenase/oxidase